MSSATGMSDSLYHHRRRTTNPRRNPGWNPYTRPNPRRTTNPRRNPGWTTNPRPRQNTLPMLSPWPTDCVTPREPPPGKAAAVRVKPAVAIVRAAKPIATLRMMMSIVLSTPGLSESNSTVPDGLQPCGTVARREPESKGPDGAGPLWNWPLDHLEGFFTFLRGAAHSWLAPVTV
jgi:hypothetical protein